MQIEISLESLRAKKLFIATPMYGGQCAGMYTRSTNDLSMAAARYGIGIQYYFLFNESLITRARNYCVDEFLRSDCTHMMFIDSDIGFNHQDVFTLMHFCSEESGMDIVTGPYPKKNISWEKVHKATKMGFGDKNPFELENFVGDYVFNVAEGVTEFRVDEPVQIREGGTGFMIIHRKVFEKYAEAYPELRYLPDHGRTANFDGSREITAFFDCIIDPASKRYLSEDYMFCHNVRKLGMTVYMCPWIELKHVGSYVFGGSMAAIAAVGASPTSDASSNPKNWLTNQSSGDTMTDPQKAPIQLNRSARRAAMKKTK